VDAPANIAGYDPHRTAGDCVYDAAAADRPVRFFQKCCQHSVGPFAGKPFLLEPWQADVVRTLYGWRRPDGRRRYRRAFIMIPRKNGKSTWAAGMALYALLGDGEAGAQVYCAAGDREQASLVFNQAADMVDLSPALSKAVKVRKSLKRIIYRNSYLRAIPANESAAHGLNPSFVCGDELHVWPNRELYDTLHTGTGARLQPLEVYITTAGHDQASICYEAYQEAVAAREGTNDDPELLPVIYEALPEEDWTDPAVWRKANPNLGVSVFEDYLHAQCEQAKRNPAYENTFRRLHLNQWTAQDSRWLPLLDWDACTSTADPIPDGEEVWAGLDLSSTTDFTALVLVAKRGAGFKTWGHYWLPRERAELIERKHNVPIARWVRDGWLSLCPGRTIEYGPIHAKILEISKRYELRGLGYDPYNAHATRVYLEDDHGLPMIEMRQGVLTLSGPSKQLERCVLEHTLDHSGDPVLRWFADNTAVKTDENGNIKPLKRVANQAKHIDGIAALVMAIGRAIADGDGRSIYEEEGSLWL
jgi:phage terminase large subunit-like protein